MEVDQKKFREYLHVLTFEVFSLCTKGNNFQACVSSVVLYCSEIYAVKGEDLAKLESNHMILHWIGIVTVKDEMKLHLGCLSRINCIQSG